jgi:hypothetical protein
MTYKQVQQSLMMFEMNDAQFQSPDAAVAATTAANDVPYDLPVPPSEPAPAPPPTEPAPPAPEAEPESPQSDSRSDQLSEEDESSSDNVSESEGEIEAEFWEAQVSEMLDWFEHAMDKANVQHVIRFRATAIRKIIELRAAFPGDERFSVCSAMGEMRLIQSCV